MLANMPKEEVEKCISGKLEAYTENTITDKKSLLEEIEKTRIRGYGIDDMEIMFGIKCVGVALLNHDGKVEGGLSISAPLNYMQIYLRNMPQRYKKCYKLVQVY